MTTKTVNVRLSGSDETRTYTDIGTVFIVNHDNIHYINMYGEYVCYIVMDINKVHLNKYNKKVLNI